MQSQHCNKRPRALIRLIVAVVVALSSVPATGVSAESGQTADQVADQIVAVQAQADDVAAQWVDRDADAKRLAIEVDAATQAVKAAAATTKAMSATLTKLAVDRYTSAIGSSFLPFSNEVMTDIQISALSGFASNSGAADLDAFQAAEADLRQKQQTMNTAEEQNSAASAKLSNTQAALDSKLAELTTLEAQLKDAEVKRAYETKVAALRAKQEADAAAAAQAALVTRPTRTDARGGGSVAPAESTPAATVANSTPPTVKPRRSDPPLPAPAPAPVPAAPRTPTTSPAPKPPEPTPAPAAAIGGLVCPVAGPNAFGDSWGDPRPGGRHHEGVDMMSPQGTPLVAVIDGAATMKTNALGGITVGLKGRDGNYYYYAHLVAWEGQSRAVNQGEVIGYVGHTGDTSANHLHFGIYAGGGRAINPYPIVRRIC